MIRRMVMAIHASVLNEWTRGSVVDTPGLVAVLRVREAYKAARVARIRVTNGVRVLVADVEANGWPSIQHHQLEFRQLFSNRCGPLHASSCVLTTKGGCKNQRYCNRTQPPATVDSRYHRP